MALFSTGNGATDSLPSVTQAFNPYPRLHLRAHLAGVLSRLVRLRVDRCSFLLRVQTSVRFNVSFKFSHTKLQRGVLFL
jgi:hypothetical protein